VRRLIVFGGLLLAAASLLSGCSASSESAALLAPVTLIDGVGFHAIDTALAAPGATVDAAWLGKTRNARIAVAALQPVVKEIFDIARFNHVLEMFASVREALQQFSAPALAAYDATAK